MAPNESKRNICSMCGRIFVIEGMNKVTEYFEYKFLTAKNGQYRIDHNCWLTVAPNADLHKDFYV